MATEDSVTGKALGGLSLLTTHASVLVGDNKVDSSANIGGGRKKKKAKPKTVALNEFLADGSSDSSFPAPKRTTSWADASEDLESDGRSACRVNNYTLLL